MKPPKVLDKLVDVVLAYRPPGKQKPPRQRKKSTKRLSGAESKMCEAIEEIADLEAQPPLAPTLISCAPGASEQN